MLDKIVSVIVASKCLVDKDILTCEHTVYDLNLIQDFYNNDLIDNTSIDDLKIGDTIDLDFVLSRLFKHGFFETKSIFLKKHRYEIPLTDSYFFDEKSYLREDNEFKEKYFSIVGLITVLKKYAKHNYEDVDISNSLLLIDDRALIISFDYSVENLNLLLDDSTINIKQFIEILESNAFVDKRNSYLNTLIEFLNPIDENKRFGYLIENFNEYAHKAQSVYNYYLRNFSYNKLIVELDSKALEFNQKLQSVINDSQTKLIAIPTAVVFVLSTFDYELINSPKNYLTLVGLIIFCIFIQLFINNQKSAISFIEQNIQQYISTFKEHNIVELQTSFNKVNKEKEKQKSRLLTIQLLLWFTPILTFSVILFFHACKLASFLLIIFYILMSIFIYIKNIC